jgi:hypothetical protein
MGLVGSNSDKESQKRMQAFMQTQPKKKPVNIKQALTKKGKK